MVKGTTRQVILVKSPDPKLFEEAIFIVREEAAQREGVTAERVIHQAQQTAKEYLKGHRRQERQSATLPGPLWGAAGAAAASVLWAAAWFVM